MGTHRRGAEPDLAAIADDAQVIDALAARRPVPVAEALVQLLAAWACEIDRDPFPALAGVAGSPAQARPGDATHNEEARVLAVDVPTVPIPRPRVRFKSRPDNRPKVHPDYVAMRDAPLLPVTAASWWPLIGAALMAALIVGVLIGMSIR